MASKKSNDTTPSETTALATSTPSSMARADILGGIDVGVTGLEEADASDFRLASITLNFNGMIDGEVPPKSVWVNTVTEKTEKTKRLVLLVLHKSRAWTEFVQGEGTKRRCSSWDNVTGTMEDGTTRACVGCPDAQWRMENGKRTRRCGDVHNVVAMERDTGELVMLRAKKTAMDPWKAFLNKYFLGKRVVNGARSNIPLFAFETQMSAEMIANKSGNYAVPVFEVVRDEKGEPKVLPVEEIQFLAETARGVRELYLDRVREVADASDGHDSAATEDTSFEFGANGGDRFVDASKGAQPETETRFG
jgi:hypothetical protein